MDYTLYHASVKQFDKFEESFINQAETDCIVNGFWFSSNERTSPAWVNPNYLKTCKVTLNNPITYTEMKKIYNSLKDNSCNNLRLELIKRGYDGFIMNDVPQINEQELNNNGYAEYITPRGSKYKLVVNTEYGGLDLYSVNKFGREECITGYNDLEDFLSLQEMTVIIFKVENIEILKDEVNPYWN